MVAVWVVELVEPMARRSVDCWDDLWADWLELMLAE